MYRNEFDKNLNQNKKSNAYMFYGQSTFLIEHYSKKVSLLHGSRDEVEKLYFDDYDFKYAKDKLLQSSLFASNNILLIKTEKKIPKKEVDSLIEACNRNPDSVVIFACLGETDFRSMEKSFSTKTNSVAVRMFAPFDSEAVKILENEAKNLNLNYEVPALNHLYFMHRHDLSLCVNDLEKLSVLDKKIDSNMVNAHCFGIGNVSFENFLNDLLNGKDISEDLVLLLEEGMNEIYLLNQITSYVQQLFMISSYGRTIGTPNAKEILGFIPPKNIWDMKCKLAVKIKPEQYSLMFDFLLGIELEFKSSKISNQNLYLQASLRKFTVLFR